MRPRAALTGRYALALQGAEIVPFDRIDARSGAGTSIEPAPAPRGVDPCERR